MISKNQIKFVRQLEQKKFRKAENLFIAETHKVVGDLLAAGFRPCCRIPPCPALRHQRLDIRASPNACHTW